MSVKTTIRGMSCEEMESLVKSHVPRIRENRQPSIISQMAKRWGVTYETARKRIQRAQMAEAGIGLHQVEVHNDDWPKVEKLVQQLRRERAANEAVMRAAAEARAQAK